MSNQVKMVARYKFFLRQLAAELMFRSGGLNAIAFKRLKDKAVVLTYHRILNRQQFAHHNSHPGICIQVDTFEKQIIFLKKHFQILTLNKFAMHINRQQPFPNRSCLITFDDGWLDNYQNAIPVLAKHQVPAVIFLSTAFIGSDNWFWQERLNAILNRLYDNGHIAPQIIEEAFNLCDLDPHWFFPSERPLSTRIDNLFSKFKNEHQQTIFRFISALENLMPNVEIISPRDRAFMNWDEVRSAPSDLISFGSHGVNHTILTVEPESSLQELSVSKSTIESELGQEIIALSYPNGNFSDKTIQDVKSCKYLLAFCTQTGFVRIEDEPFALSRINIHESVSNTPSLFYASMLFHK